MSNPDDSKDDEALQIITVDELNELEITREQKVQERQRQVMQLRTRGYTYQNIANALGTSIATVQRDLEAVKSLGKSNFSEHDRDQFLTGLFSGYDDVIARCWELHSEGTPDEKLKALNLVRQTLNDQKKALIDTGVIKKEHQINQQVEIGLSNAWTPELKNEVIRAFMEAKLTKELEAPEPYMDDEEVQYIEVSENEDEDEDDSTDIN